MLIRLDDDECRKVLQKRNDLGFRNTTEMKKNYDCNILMGSKLCLFFWRDFEVAMLLLKEPMA